jgi:predicted CxxxxCH...CXXCH cytochrome family protein
VVFSSGALIVAGGGTAPAFTGGANGQCTNTYCHGAKMPGGDTTGSNRSPAWGTPFLPATITVAACGTCHGFPPSTASGHPPVTAPTSFPLGSGCNCHGNINGAGTSYGTIFVNKALHINGIFEPAASGHAFPYGGSVHRPGGTGNPLANNAAPYTNCSGCHNTTTAGGTYPVTSGVIPLCSACHLNMTNFSGTTPGCWDCHGASAADGRPNGSTFPNRQGSSDGHNRSTHRLTCTSCHPITSGSTAHGWSNRVKSTNAQVLPALNWTPGTRATNNGTCNPSAGGFSGCHGSKTGWY